MLIGGLVMMRNGHGMWMWNARSSQTVRSVGHKPGSLYVFMAFVMFPCDIINSSGWLLKLSGDRIMFCSLLV